jgi:hypothetical protein
MRLPLVVVGALLVALSACGSSAVPKRPGDERLARRIAPTAADLGPRWRHESSASAHARRAPCPKRTTGCVWRFFVLPGDPAVIPSAAALVQVFASAAEARSAYTSAKRTLSTTRTIDNDKARVQEIISLHSEANLVVGGAHAALLVFSVKVTAPVRMTETSRAILVQEGRAQLSVTFKAGRTTPFPTTARRLAVRIRPARG